MLWTFRLPGDWVLQPGPVVGVAGESGGDGAAGGVVVADAAVAGGFVISC